MENGKNKVLIDGSISIQKNFNQFHNLHNELKAEGYFGLPDIPAKTVLPVTQKGLLDKRRKDLEVYLKSLVNYREWKNSRQLVKFLNLQDLFSDLIESLPDPIFSFRDR